METPTLFGMEKAPDKGAFSFFGRKRIDRWQLLILLIALTVALPLIVVLSSIFSPTQEIWDHLVQYVLPDLLVNTFLLVSGVAVGTLVLGVSLAWLTSVCEFPLRKVFSWALMLPLAIPAYVTAFVFIGLLDFTGPVQTALRSWFDTTQLWFPNVRSAGGVIIVMSLTLYPYVYLLARNAFLSHGTHAMEVAQSLGHNRRKAFFLISLPMARPWIAAGLMLALMETLADFGTVSIFNYDTFTTAIYKTWFGLFSITGAAQLSSLLLLIVFVLLIVEQHQRSRARFSAARKHAAPTSRIRLEGKLRVLAFGYAALVLLLAFIIPVMQLLLWTIEVFKDDFGMNYLTFVSHSLLLGALGAAVTAVAALVLAYARRLRQSAWVSVFTRIATLGYAIPGAVLAVGIFMVIAWVDNQWIGFMERLTGRDIGTILQGTLLTMLLAYLIRFLAVAYNPVESALQRVTPNIDEASRSLGLNALATFKLIHLPLLRSGLTTAVLLVFVDIMKEMPITLMTRPFGWDTLAVRIFEMTSEGQWERAALPALALVLAGLLPIALLSRHSEKASF